jgi:hydroxypyruvate reductase 1
VCISRFTTLQATLAAANIAAHLQHYPVWTNQDVLPFVDGPFEEIPKAAPSIVNAKDLGLKEFSD